MATIHMYSIAMSYVFCDVNGCFRLLGRFAFYTRSSGIAEGPHDASCQLKSRQLPRNSAETTCTTSPEQIELYEVGGLQWPTCNKHVHSTMTRSSRFHCPIVVINKLTTDRVVDITCVLTLAVAKFSKSTM